jgi:3-oxoisoapionate decarboxylase
MTIGLSTYSFFWQWHATADRPLSLTDMLARTQEWGADLLQICDYPAVEEYDGGQLLALSQEAGRRGVGLELGTRGIGVEHLERYLGLARRLDVRLVRSMVPASEADDAEVLLRAVLPSYERAGVVLALETYEQISTARLVDVVESLDSPALGVCLDPANCVAALEHPRDTVERTAGHVVNLHVKDFSFSRQAGWVGFTLAGAPLGEGLLDLEHLFARVRPEERGISQVVEHWLVWQGDSATTCRVEDDWTRHSLQWLHDRARRTPSGAGRKERTDDRRGNNP